MCGIILRKSGLRLSFGCEDLVRRRQFVGKGGVIDGLEPLGTQAGTILAEFH